MRPLLAAFVATVATVSLTSTAGAAPRPQITDAKGDQLPVAGAGYDIVSARFSTEGHKTKAGRKTYYTPTKLLIKMTYAGAVPTDAHAAQVVTFNLASCADVYLESYDGGTFASADCLADPFDFTVRKSGSTVTYVLPFSIIGKKHLKKGAKLTDLVTYTAFADPVLGYETAELTTAAVDSATTKSAYTIR